MPAVLPLNRGALETKECDASRNNISNDAGSSSDGCKGDDDRFETFIADVSYFTFNTKYLTQTTMQTVSSSLAIALGGFERPGLGFRMRELVVITRPASYDGPFWRQRRSPESGFWDVHQHMRIKDRKKQNMHSTKCHHPGIKNSQHRRLPNKWAMLPWRRRVNNCLSGRLWRRKCATRPPDPSRITLNIILRGSS
mmetsp:Transcript_40813/g.66977  ORF Transcript_40813/g.66977 Transcript_40813/m.66977 type:complete len:196 (-) Transcript_40813:1476-2063(-)